MYKTSEYERKGFEGVDQNLEISLNEYGLIWKEYKRKSSSKFALNFEKGDFHFIYIDSYGNIGNCFFNKNIDIKKEFSWIKESDWDSFLSYIGMTFEEFLDQNFGQQIFELFRCYGDQNIFGVNY